jgi:hypothetical protein
MCYYLCCTLSRYFLCIGRQNRNLALRKWNFLAVDLTNMCSMYDIILFKARCYISTVFINAQRIHQLFLLDTKGNLVNCVKVRFPSITLNAIINVACFISLVAEYITVTKLRLDIKVF